MKFVQPPDYPYMDYIYEDSTGHFFIMENLNYSGPYPNKKTMLAEFHKYCKKIQDENNSS
jgi:hypothetical protein